MKVLRWLDDHFEETLMGILLVALTCVSFAQVIIRKLPFIPALTWAEEFCRYCWIWSVFLSLPYTLKKCNMLRVTVLLDAMPQTMRKIFNLFVDVVNVAVMAFLFWYSIPVLSSRIESLETSTAMGLPMWIMYAAMVIGFGLGVIRGIEALIDHIVHFKVKVLSGVEQSVADAQEEIQMAQASEGLVEDTTEEGKEG